MSKMIKEIQTSIPMPKTISIGDPLYFEQYKDQPQRLAQLVYQGSFRRPSWKAAVKLVQTEETYEFGGEEKSYPLYSLIVACAPNDEFLNTYLQEEYFSGQRVKSTEIGVDSAKYAIEINEYGIIVNTGSDGGFGAVNEFYRGQKLEGILIVLSLGDLYDFEDHQKDLEYVFNVHF